MFSQENSKVDDLGRKSLSDVTTINELIGLDENTDVESYFLILVQDGKAVERSSEFASFEENLADLSRLSKNGELLYIEKVVFRDPSGKTVQRKPSKLTILK